MPTQDRHNEPADTLGCDPTECNGDVSEIHMIVDGSALTLRLCPDCDRREWRRNGTSVDLTRVLADITHARLRYRHNLEAASRTLPAAVGSPRERTG